jgi:hypothetical protein
LNFIFISSITDAILSIDGISSADLSAEIAILENDIYADMSMTTGNLFVLFSATQTARSSYDYWVNNMAKWSELGGGHGDVAYAVAGDIAKGDVGGAVGAAAATWVVNAIPGAGQVAYGGAIAAGAVGTSVGVAVVAFLDWLW